MSKQDLWVFLGEEITRARKKLDISQESLGEDLGVSRTSIVNFELGRQKFPLEKMLTLCKLLGLKFPDLLEKGLK